MKGKKPIRSLFVVEILHIDSNEGNLHDNKKEIAKGIIYLQYELSALELSKNVQFRGDN